MTTALLSLSPGADKPGAATKKGKRARLLELGSQLKHHRQSFESHWTEIAELFRPRRIRLQASNRNRGQKVNQKIIDSTQVFAARTLSAGIMSSITSPARIWFKMAIADKDLMEHGAVKQWLEDVREQMATVLSRSNFYEVLSPYYSDLGVFGTSALIVEEDDDKVIRLTHFAIGEYWLGYNAKQHVRVFMREFSLNVRQVVEQFGERTENGYSTENLSKAVQTAWKQGTTEEDINIVHVVYENMDYDESRLEAKHKQFASCYFEPGAESDKMLNEGGYEEWPVMAVRWETTTGDVYGTDCPGMTALGDVKDLQFSKKKGAMAIEKAVNPPMIGPVELMNVAATVLPGGVTYLNESSDKKFRPAYDTSSFRLDWLQAWVSDVRDSINRAMFVDLFLLISQIDRGDVTATEILEKKEEKLLVLGPLAKQIDGGFLDPFFDRLYGIMLRRGLIPEPPPEMEGVTFHPEYESIMAQAQRAQGRGGIDAFAIFVQTVAKNDPTILDRVNADEMVKRYAEATGVSPKFINPDDAVAEIRQARAQAEAKQQAAEQAALVAESASKLAGSDTGGKNALTDLLGNQDSGVLGTPSPVGGL